MTVVKAQLGKRAPILRQNSIHCETIHKYEAMIVVKAQLGKRASILRQNPSISVGAYLGTSV